MRLFRFWCVLVSCYFVVGRISRSKANEVESGIQRTTDSSRSHQENYYIHTSRIVSEVEDTERNQLDKNEGNIPSTGNANNKDKAKNGNDDAEKDSGEIRTATGGLIYTLMVTLTVIAFLSNGAFLVYVFWLSK